MEAGGVKARLIAWVRESAPEWWSPVDAASALGVPGGEVRMALEELEIAGLVYRAVAKTDSFRLTANGRDEERA